MLSAVCDSCGRSFKAPRSAAGKKTVCPKCGGRVRVAAADTDQSSSREPDAFDTSLAGTSGESDHIKSDLPEVQIVVDHRDMSRRRPFSPEQTLEQNAASAIQIVKSPDSAEQQKACPFCGELILAVAKKCKHCNEFLVELTNAGDLAPTGVGSKYAKADSTAADTVDQSQNQRIFWWEIKDENGFSATAKVITSIFMFFYTLTAVTLTFMIFFDKSVLDDRVVWARATLVFWVSAIMFLMILMRKLSWSLGQVFGLIVLSWGLLVISSANQMDTTVGNVHNIGKLQAQQNGIMIGIAISGAGLATILLGRRPISSLSTRD